MEVDGKQVVLGARRHLTEILIGLGVALRVGTYLAGRSYWLDEGSLAGNIAGNAVFDLYRPLVGTQLAPPGFLAVERAAAWAFGDSTYSLRLFPLICGLASIFLFRELARRCQGSQGVRVAVALFALSGDLIYFSSELKQYSSDVAAALCAYLIVLGVSNTTASVGRIARWGMAGAALVWFSHPSAFVLGGAGGSAILAELARRRWKRAAMLGALAGLWGASFAACHRVSMVQLPNPMDMTVFWYFAFLPLPPTSLGDLRAIGLHFLDLFVNPLILLTPFGLRASALLAAALFVVGGVSLWSRKREWFLPLISPLLLAMLASGARAYPFHGRTILFLVPSLYLVIVEGVERVGEKTGRGVAYRALVALLILSPLVQDLYYCVEPRFRPFDPHGDLRPKQFT